MATCLSVHRQIPGGCWPSKVNLSSNAPSIFRIEDYSPHLGFERGALFRGKQPGFPEVRSGLTQLSGGQGLRKCVPNMRRDPNMNVRKTSPSRF